MSDLPSGASPFGPAAAAAAKAVTPAFVFGAAGPGGGAPAAPDGAGVPAGGPGPAPPGHTPEPSPRQMAEAIETLAAPLSQLQSQLQQQQREAAATAQTHQSRINQLELELNASKLEASRSSEVNAWIAEALEKLGEKPAATVDTKGVGKPFAFASDEAKFHAWQKKVRNYVSASLPGAREFLEWAGDQGSDPSTRPALEE